MQAADKNPTAVCMYSSSSKQSTGAPVIGTVWAAGSANSERKAAGPALRPKLCVPAATGARPLQLQKKYKSKLRDA